MKLPLTTPFRSDKLLAVVLQTEVCCRDGRFERTVAEQRSYHILTAEDVRQIARRVPLLAKERRVRADEAVIDAPTSLVCEDKTTAAHVLEKRLSRPGWTDKKEPRKRDRPPDEMCKLSALRNTIACGDAEDILPEDPLIWSSPRHLTITHGLSSIS